LQEAVGPLIRGCNIHPFSAVSDFPTAMLSCVICKEAIPVTEIVPTAARNAPLR